MMYDVLRKNELILSLCLVSSFLFYLFCYSTIRIQTEAQIGDKSKTSHSEQAKDYSS